MPFLNLVPLLSSGTVAAAPSDTSLSINFGGGLKKYLTDRYGIRLDFRNYLSRPLGDTVDNIEVSLGLILRL
jgi:hypothetical protein